TLTTVNNAAKQGDKTFNFVLLAPTGNVSKSFTIKDITVVQTPSANPNVIGTAQQQLPASNQAQAGGAAFASGAGAGLPAGVGTPVPAPQPVPAPPKCGYVPSDGIRIVDKVINDKTYNSYKFGFFGLKTYTGGTASPTSLSQVKLKQGQAVVVGSLQGFDVYGSGPYTSDSDWGKAAVHAGLIKPGEKAIIQFTTEGELTRYVSTDRNGVITKSYNKPWCGFNISLVTLVD
ncbi:MAG: LCCL domain-containing protein, partial [Bacteroidia bacterium]